MKPVERNEILGLADYETLRDRFRARVIEEKRIRRVALGPRATAVFENRDTVLMQVQEMLRTERITREAAILHEIATYNELLPGHDELSATVMIEIADTDVRDRFLVEARGFERAVALVVDGERQAAKWDPARELPERTSAVHYLKFPLSEKAAAHLRAKTKDARIEMVVDHPAYQAKVPLSPAAAASLAEDLA
jgi:hypothetical protein